MSNPVDVSVVFNPEVPANYPSRVKEENYDSMQDDAAFTLYPYGPIPQTFTRTPGI